MIRRILVAAALLPITLVTACSDDGGGSVTPTGDFYHYVVNKAFIPQSSTEARMFGLDVDGMEGVDNQLGMVLATLKQYFDIQKSIDEAVNAGDINLLVSLQTPSFTAAGGAGVAVLLGDPTTVMPAPCTDPTMPATCGKHLDGNGMFTVKGDVAAALTGKIVNGTFNGGPGNLTIAISLAGANVELNLIGARAQVSGMSDTAITSAIVAGAVSQDDLNTKVLPAIQSQLTPLIAASCNKLDMPTGTPACGCTDGSTGAQVVSLFDTTPKDCAITVSEIQNNGLIMSLLAPDVVVDGKMALSIGLKVSTVKGTFTVAGE
ncbi:MAG: hypothetical protein NT062_00240 [Proteobacteria bacterium]|nr:hypothetical protein [Pseudomonadota bacterium]